MKRNTKEIVLNALQLKIHNALLSTAHTKTETQTKASNITYDDDRRRATISFDNEVPASSKASLELKFQGTINNVSDHVNLKLSLSFFTTR